MHYFLQLPCLRPHKKLLLRLVVVARRRSSPRAHVLVSERTSAHLPVCELNPARSMHSTLRRFLTEIFGADLPPHRPHGLLSVEHSGRPEASNDGCCLTLLLSVRAPLEEACLIDKYSWREVTDDDLGQRVMARLGKNLTIPITVIR